MTLVVGSAGHIDHGKTTLLRALTGIDPDRLPEEQRRGMTIDVGYAHLDLEDGAWIDFVDVPGHDRLIGNMLVGAGEVDAALLVVAADDGPRPQTIEHLELLDALGIARGIVAITKADLVDDERVEVVTRDVQALLAPTALAGAPVRAVSAASGVGLEAVRAALLGLGGTGRAAPPAAARAGTAHLAIDRAFAVRGRGAVVTGTLRGTISPGQVLRIEPGGLSARVREVQVHGQAVERSTGGRTAVNLAGVDVSRLRRGQVLATAESVSVSNRLLVALRPPRPLRRAAGALPRDGATLRLHLGTDQVGARVGRSGRIATELPGGRVTALLRLDRPVAVAAGDRFVLREPSPGLTAAGGVVLDADPPTGVSRRRASEGGLAALAAAADQTERAAARLALHGAIASSVAVRLAPDVEAAGTEAALAAVATHHAERPSEPGPAAAELRALVATELRRGVTLTPDAASRAAGDVVAALVAAGRLVRDADRLRHAGHRPAGPGPALLLAMERLEQALDAFAPPPLADAARAAACSDTGIRELERSGRIVRPEPDLAWTSSAWDRLVRLALDEARRAPLTPARLRDVTGTSRKYVMAILEELDRRGLLARTPAGHVPGPRAATVEREPVA